MRGSRSASLVEFLYEFHTAQAGLVVTAAFVRSRRQLDLFARDLLVHSLDETATSLDMA